MRTRSPTGSVRGEGKRERGSAYQIPHRVCKGREGVRTRSPTGKRERGGAYQIPHRVCNAERFGQANDPRGLPLCVVCSTTANPKPKPKPKPAEGARHARQSLCEHTRPLHAHARLLHTRARLLLCVCVCVCVCPPPRSLSCDVSHVHTYRLTRHLSYANTRAHIQHAHVCVRSHTTRTHHTHTQPHAHAHTHTPWLNWRIARVRAVDCARKSSPGGKSLVSVASSSFTGYARPLGIIPDHAGSRGVLSSLPSTSAVGFLRCAAYQHAPIKTTSLGCRSRCCWYSTCSCARPACRHVPARNTQHAAHSTQHTAHSTKTKLSVAAGSRQQAAGSRQHIKGTRSVAAQDRKIPQDTARRKKYGRWVGVGSSTQHTKAAWILAFCCEWLPRHGKTRCLDNSNTTLRHGFVFAYSLQW